MGCLCSWWLIRRGCLGFLVVSRMDSWFSHSIVIISLACSMYSSVMIRFCYREVRNCIKYAL